MTGIINYTTTTKGIGGEIKRKIPDFIVREIPRNGKKLENKAFGDWEGKKEIELKIPQQPESMDQLYLEMEKFNLDTNEAVKRIARALRFSQKRIGYAGMKDKRAITIQKISIWQPDVQLVEKFYSRYISLSNPSWGTEKLTIGNLSKNEFEITIRNIEMKESELKKTTEKSLKEMENGVANYFGEQRFGGIRKVTHRVGKEFIKGNFENAIMMYLTSPAKEEEESIAIARKNLAETKDFVKATKEFPTKFRYERLILQHLCKFPRDYVGAFQMLPKNLVYMFTHAYQSYLFNEIINERIERGIGLKAVEGDVLEDEIPIGALFGIDSELATGIPGEIEKKILKNENLKLSDFKVKGFPELSCTGTRKKISLKPENPKILKIMEDETNEGKLKISLSFTLDKGNYATTNLRELMKTP